MGNGILHTNNPRLPHEKESSMWPLIDPGRPAVSPYVFVADDMAVGLTLPSLAKGLNKQDVTTLS
jgi:hypothetical protein